MASNNLTSSANIDGSTALMSDPAMTATTSTLHNKGQEKFWFYLEDLLRFLFPDNLQHPLAASRLFIFGMYGPLDEFGQLRSGRQGSHVITEYELETMCQQIEREDVVRVYVGKGKGIGLLSSLEQEQLISQADSKLKTAKGKAMLPPLSKEEVIALFQVSIHLFSVLLILVHYLVSCI